MLTTKIGNRDASVLAVGTRGGVGWVRGPCACPGWSATHLPDETQTSRVVTRTSTRPPPVPTSAPCPYRTLGCKQPSHYRIWLYIFIIGQTGTPPCILV